MNTTTILTLRPTSLTVLSLLVLLSLSVVAAVPSPCGVCLCDDTFADCSNRGLSAPPPGLPANTTVLDLTFNRIEIIDSGALGALSNLQLLNISHNFLLVLLADSFAGPTNLTVLDLSHNELVLLKGDFLTPLKSSLTTLNLGFNKIAALPNNTLADIPRLAWLSLGNNFLPAWPASLSSSSLSSLDLSNNPIGEWPALLPPRLKYLNVANCPLKYVPDSLCGSLPSLEYLSLSGCQLASVPNAVFSACARSLTSLDISSNLLLTLPTLLFNDSTAALQLLNASHCRLIDIAQSTLAPLSFLRVLDLTGNILTSLPTTLFSSTLQLQELYLRNNTLALVDNSTFVPLAPTLKVLSLRDNPLLALPASVSLLSSLLHLDISSCLLTEFAPDIFVNMVNLTFLNFNLNQITTLSPTLLLNLRSLESISFAHNLLTTLPASLFEGFTNIKTLQFQLNPISELPDDIFAPLAKTLLGLNMGNSVARNIPTSVSLLCALEVLYLDQLLIDKLDPHLFDCMSSLGLLSLTGNFLLTSLPPNIFAHSSAIVNLILSNNALTSLPSLPPAVQSLTISGNPFPPGPLSPQILARPSLLGLTATACNINQISSSDMAHLPALETLILSSNLIQDIPNGTFAGSVHLVEIELSYNSIRTIGSNVWPAPSLFDLRLAGNQLSALAPDVFASAPGLTNLLLSQNFLRSLPPTIFAPLTKLQSLVFQVNQLSSLDASLFTHNTELLYLDFSAAGPITTLPATLFASTTHIEYLNMNNMTLESLPCGILDSMPRLSSFSIQLNRLRNISLCWLAPLSKASQLSFAGNQLSSIGDTLASFSNLEILSLDSNLFSVFPDNLPASLKYLSLSQNQLITVSLAALVPLTELVTLDLAGNLLVTQVAETIVTTLSHINAINLSNNRLTGTFQIPIHTSLNLANNRIDYIRPAEPSTNPLLFGQAIIVNNSLPAFACPPGTYGESPACYGFCSLVCLSSVITDIGLFTFSSCSGPNPSDCCPYGLSGSSCQYAFRCQEGMCGTGRCLDGPESDVYGLRCECPSSMLSYQPTSSRVLATTNTPRCVHACPKYTFRSSATQCSDCSDSCEQGCSGSADVCLNPQLTHAIEGGAAGAVAALILIVTGLILYRKSRLRARAAQRRYVELHDNVERYWLVNMADLVLEKQLAHGAFGEVWRADWAGRTVAVKKLRQAIVEGDPTAYSDFEKEISFYKQHLRHRNLCLFFGAGVDPRDKAPFLVLEYMERGALRSLLDDDALELSWDIRLSLASDTARGMRYLHEQTPPILHRDLKASNVFVSQRWIAKIGDLGESRLASLLQRRGGVQDDDEENTASGSLDEPLLRGATRHRGTLGWQAPEVCQQRAYGLSADVFSFAMVVWEIASRDFPFSHIPESESFRVVEQIIQGVRPPTPPDCPPLLADLILRCWAHVPEDRPSFRQLLQDLENIDM